MSLIVQKFGGSSVADKAKLERAARIAADTYDEGNDVIVVVSAQGDTTDELIEKAAEITPNPDKREMDVLFNVGEQISIALLTMTIQKMGYKAVSLTGWQAGFQTNDFYGKAQILDIDTSRMKEEIAKGSILVIAGFQGLDRHGNLTTLGRGGSDTSAVAIAAAMKAEKCQIFTDVDGVYTTDPRIVPAARKIETISFDEMLEFASLGAGVLHNRSVELAKKYHVDLEVAASYDRHAKTKVLEVEAVEQVLVRGVTKDDDVARITVEGVPDVPGIASAIFSVLADRGINVDVIIQSVDKNDIQDISFTVSMDNLDEAVTLLRNHIDQLKGTKIGYDSQVSKVSIVGAGMVHNPGVAADMFKALAQENINIQMISTSEIKVSVLIDKADADKAVRAIHKKLIEERE